MSAENKLIFAGRYAIFGVQFNCYLPLSIFKDKLIMSFTSVSFLIQTACNLTVLFDLGVMGAHSGDFAKLETAFTYTETFIITTVSMITFFTCVFFRIYGIWQRNSTLEFWQSNVKLLSDFNIFDGPEIDRQIIKIRNSVRNTLLLLLCIIFGFLTAWLLLTFLYRKDLEAVGFPRSTLAIISQAYFSFIAFSHGTQAIWLDFYIKLYAAMLHLIESKLFPSLGLNFTPANELSKVSFTMQFDDETKECYTLYLKVEKQVEYFNSHFKTQLVLESPIGIFIIVSYVFLLLRLMLFEMESVRLLTLLIMITPVIIAGKSLYGLSTGGSRLSEAVSRISDRIHHVYTEGPLNFKSRQDLQMFAMKTSKPFVVDAGQYFAVNRSLLTTVRKCLVSTCFT